LCLVAQLVLHAFSLHLNGKFIDGSDKVAIKMELIEFHEDFSLKEKFTEVHREQLWKKL
jgi:hypothetical protein